MAKPGPNDLSGGYLSRNSRTCSPYVPEYAASADSLPALRELVCEGIAFALNRPGLILAVVQVGVGAPTEVRVSVGEVAQGTWNARQELGRTPTLWLSTAPQLLAV